MKYALWSNVKSKFLAADSINKEYYFTKNKNDLNLFIKSQMNLIIISKFEDTINESLVWYAL